jgi:hypothetical protein
MKTATTRRTFIGAALALLAAVRRALGRSLLRLVPNRQEQHAADKGRELGIGTVALKEPRQVDAYSMQTWTLVYTAGKGGVKGGGGLRIGLRHLLKWHARMPQTRQPSGDGYITAKAGDVPVTVSIPRNMWAKRPRGGRLGHQYFAWQNIVQVTIGKPGLKPGTQLRITFGDRSGGGPGWRTQPFDETHFGFKCYADISGGGEYLPIEEIPTVEILATAPTKLTVLVPSNAQAGKPCWCLVRAEDRFGNPAAKYRGKVQLTSTDPRARLPEAFTFTANDQGIHRFENIVLHMSLPKTLSTFQAKDLRLLPWSLTGSNCHSGQSWAEAESAKKAILETFACKCLWLLARK